MLCRERDTLFENYRHLVERLSEVVMELRAGRGTAEFNEVYRISEAVRAACDDARLELEQHRAEHGC
jgi:predicted secreted protein